MHMIKRAIKYVINFLMKLNNFSFKEKVYLCVLFVVLYFVVKMVMKYFIVIERMTLDEQVEASFNPEDRDEVRDALLTEITELAEEYRDESDEGENTDDFDERDRPDVEKPPTRPPPTPQSTAQAMQRQSRMRNRTTMMASLTQ